MPLDGMRAIAILWVVLYHSLMLMPSGYPRCLGEKYSILVTGPMGNGGAGVDIFFVISGFLIGYIMLRDLEKCNGQIDLMDFFRSRFLRIWPAMICMTPYLLLTGKDFS